MLYQETNLQYFALSFLHMQNLFQHNFLQI